MYKSDRNRQQKFTDFNQPAGMRMNPDNRWVRKAETIPWARIEERYSSLFPSRTGMPAKPLRCALGALLIQKQYGYSDRELVEQIRENPYYQYFIGLPGYLDKQPFAPSLLVEFRKRLTEDILGEINEMIIGYNSPDDKPPADGGDGEPPENGGTLILDATCAPQEIAYPQDINLLNEARENLERIIGGICREHGYDRPRMYRRNARKDYLGIAKCRKRSERKLRKAVRKQLQYVRRDLGYIDGLLGRKGTVVSERTLVRVSVIRELYRQQEYMYRNRVHSVEDRIVSISQPYIRPIVRGKAKTPTEFGAKLDMSIDERGMARVERLSFDAYNEVSVLVGAVERYKERTGHYPERVLVDKIYRSRQNRQYCKDHKIRISGPALGRPRQMSVEEKEQAYKDNVDRIEVERRFSLAKRRFGLGLIRTRLDATTRSSIMLSVIAMNVAALTGNIFFLPLLMFFPWFVLRKIHLETVCKKAIRLIKTC